MCSIRRQREGCRLQGIRPTSYWNSQVDFEDRMRDNNCLWGTNSSQNAAKLYVVAEVPFLKPYRFLKSHMNFRCFNYFLREVILISHGSIVWRVRTAATRVTSLRKAVGSKTRQPPANINLYVLILFNIFHLPCIIQLHVWVQRNGLGVNT
jgi:hypothetical protein